MHRKGWYLIAYDIACHRRLARIHRLIKKEGLAAQKSLFFFEGSEAKVNSLLDRIAPLMHKKKDDLRAYPVTRPQEIWTNGTNPLTEFPVICPSSKKGKKKKKSKLLKYLFALVK